MSLRLSVATLSFPLRLAEACHAPKTQGASRACNDVAFMSRLALAGRLGHCVFFREKAMAKLQELRIPVETCLTCHERCFCTCREPFNFTPMGANSILPAYLHVRPMGRTCR